MNNEIKIKSTISPFLEERIINQDIDKEVINYFFNIKKNLANYKHSIYYKLPAYLKAYLISSPKAKLFFEIIEQDTQSNILIDLRNKKDTDCKDDISKLFDFDYELYSLNQIIKSLKNNNNEFLLGITDKDLSKKKCSCDRMDFSGDCKNNKNFKVNKIENDDKFKKEVEKFSNLEFYENWVFRCKEISELDIKKLFILFCKMHNLNEEYIKKISNIIIDEYFISDIKNKKKKELTSIMTSLYRVILFPPISSTNKTHFSIDYHTESKLPKYKDYFIFRADVVPGFQTGIKNSGTQRINFVVKGGEKIIIAFTDNHDVNTDTLKTRIRGLIKKEKEKSNK